MNTRAQEPRRAEVELQVIEKLVAFRISVGGVTMTPEIMRNFTDTRDTVAKPASSKTSRPKCDVSRVAL